MRTLYFLLALALGAPFVLMAACGDPTEQCSGYAFISCGSRSVQACCTSTQCRYVVSDGTVFECSGTNCNAAATSLASYCQ